MTTQLPPRERTNVDVQPERQSPDVLFEEARRRRRRRWIAGSALAATAIIALAVILGMAGGGGGGSGGQGQRQPSGSGPAANSGHVTASRSFPGAPATQGYYTGPGASCVLAPRSRYLPKWSGCVSTMIADVYGDGRRDLVLAYSRLSHVSLQPVPRLGKQPRRYPAEQAMLRIVSPDGKIITAPIIYRIMPVNKTPARLVKVAATALISVAHVSDEPGKTIFLQTGQISSGSIALAYGISHGRLVPSGVVLAYGGDATPQAGFQCLASKPPQLLQNTFALIRPGIKIIHRRIYGWWRETTVTYAWHGPRLVEITQHTVKRHGLAQDTVGSRCIKGIT